MNRPGKVSTRELEYDIVVDALFGTGLSRPLEGIFLKAVDHLTMITADERSFISA